LPSRSAPKYTHLHSLVHYVWSFTLLRPFSLSSSDIFTSTHSGMSIGTLVLRPPVPSCFNNISTVWCALVHFSIVLQPSVSSFSEHNSLVHKVHTASLSHSAPTPCTLLLRNVHIYIPWFIHWHVHSSTLLRCGTSTPSSFNNYIFPSPGGHWFTPPLCSDFLLSPAPKFTQLHSLVHYVHSFT
jgi:hypothetical protein